MLEARELNEFYRLRYNSLVAGLVIGRNQSLLLHSLQLEARNVKGNMNLLLLSMESAVEPERVRAEGAASVPRHLSKAVFEAKQAVGQRGIIILSVMNS